MESPKTSTESVLHRLLNTKSIDSFFRRFDDDMNNFPALHVYISNLCTEKGVTAGSVIEKSDIERTYGHKFFNGTRTPSRDKILQLAFGFELDFEQTQKLLSVARESPLHPKVKRDAAIIFALKKKLNVNDIQHMLHELGLSVLGKDNA
jgi:hypothetical protein